MRDRVILSLYDRSGAWSRPYRDAGYTVLQVDLGISPESEDRRALDVRTLPYLGPVHGILAAPPCTMFANSGARWKRTDAEMLEALACVDAVYRIVKVSRPKWWALENPPGKLVRYIGPATYAFDPCDFGDPYTKRTQLWGDFNTDLPKTPVHPSEGSKMHFIAPSANRAALRSVTPPGFARAFFAANP